MTAVDNDFLVKLAAERGMYDTFCRMFRLVDTRQYERIGEECFAPEAIIEYQILPGKDQKHGEVQRFTGRDALTAYMLNRTRHQLQMHAHIVGQTTFDWSGKHPRLSAHVTALHWFTAYAALGVLRPADWTTLGLVVDEFEKLDGLWRISRRHVSTPAGLVVTGSPPPDLEPSNA